MSLQIELGSKKNNKGSRPLMIVVCLRSMWVPLDEALTWIMAAGLSFVAFVVLLVVWAKRLRKTNKSVIVEEEEAEKPNLELDFTVLRDNVERAKKEMLSLELELDMLRHALTRFYEVEAKGDISEDEGRRLVEKYKNGLRELEEKIAMNQALITLYEQIEPSKVQKPSVVRSSKKGKEDKRPKPKKIGKEKTGKEETDEKIEAIEKEVLETLKMLEKLEEES